MFVLGEVMNTSSIKLANVMAVGEFRTKDGTLVKAEDSLIDYNPILPGQTSPFKAGGTDNPAIVDCYLSFKTLFGQKIAYTTVEDESKKDKDSVIEAQRLLVRLGYKIGAPDGIPGAKTKEAIRNFQHKQGLNEDGQVSPQLLGHLRHATQ